MVGKIYLIFFTILGLNKMGLGLAVEEIVFGKEPGDGGRPTGEGYVKFRTAEDTELALQKNGQHLGKRFGH